MKTHEFNTALYSKSSSARPLSGNNYSTDCFHFFIHRSLIFYLGSVWGRCRIASLMLWFPYTNTLQENDWTFGGQCPRHTNTQSLLQIPLFGGVWPPSKRTLTVMASSIRNCSFIRPFLSGLGTFCPSILWSAELMLGHIIDRTWTLKWNSKLPNQREIVFVNSLEAWNLTGN